jgi:hypothetical protein
MRRILVSIVGCLVVPFVALAEIQISFVDTVYSVYTHTGANMPLGSTIGYYWSLDNSISGFLDNNPLNPGGGDQLLGIFDMNTLDSNPPDGGAARIGPQTFGAGSSNHVPGFFYAVAFEYAYSSYSGSGTISNGTWYGIGPTMALHEQYLVSPPPGVDDYGSLVDAAPITANTGTIQPIPEPGTLSLLGLGLLVAGGRRAFRKK